MEDLQSTLTIAFAILMFMLTIKIWNRIAEHIGGMLGIRRLVEWFLKKAKI